MTRSLGISLQPDGYQFVLLDGSAKRYSVKARGDGRFDPESRDAEKALGKAIARGLKEGGVGKVDEMVVTLPTLDTVLRELSLPFNDREKVQQVLKFEVESDLYHLDIDDVVCDFVEIDDERATSTVLVAAEPKADIGFAIDVLSEAGLDPELLDVDLGALVCALQERAKEDDETVEAALEAFLYLGPYSSLLVVMAGSSLRAVRAIKVGWRELGRGLEDQPVAHVEAEDAEEEGVSEVEVSEDDGDEDEVPEGTPARPFGADPSLPVGLDLDDMFRRADADTRAAMVRRLASEVRRGLAAVASAPVGRLHLLGAFLPGLDEALQARLGIPASPLELSDEDVDPIALGAAIRGLGSTASRMNFRQEEFRVTRGLERVEGPLTWMLVGLIAYLLVEGVVFFQRTKPLETDTRTYFAHAQAQVEKLNEQLTEDDPESWRIRTSFEGTDIPELKRIVSLRGRVAAKVKEIDEIIGEAGVDMPQSCLEAWRIVMNTLESELGDYNRRGNRWMLESVELTSMDASSRKDAHVVVKLGLTMFGSDALAIDRKFESVMRVLSGESWALSPAESPNGIEQAKVPGARTATVTIEVVPIKVSPE